MQHSLAGAEYILVEAGVRGVNIVKNRLFLKAYQSILIKENLVQSKIGCRSNPKCIFLLSKHTYIICREFLLHMVQLVALPIHSLPLPYPDWVLKLVIVGLLHLAQHCTDESSGTINVIKHQNVTYQHKYTLIHPFCNSNSEEHKYVRKLSKIYKKRLFINILYS